MHAGEAIGCFGLTEPDAGSDPGAMRTHARRDGSDWVMNGAKMWITNGTIADVAIVWARTEDGGSAASSSRRAWPASRRRRSSRSSRCARPSPRSSSCEDVRVPKRTCFPEVEDLRGPLACLNEARYGIVWGAVGAARACFESALDYAKERIVFGKPIPAIS